MVHSKLIKLAFALTTALVLTGCIVSDRDVSRDPAFLVGYRPGEIYRLRQPVDLLEVEDAYGEWGELLPPGQKRQYGKPAGTLPAGTIIRIISLRHTVTAAPIQWETGVATKAELVSRPGFTFYLDDISRIRWIDGDSQMKTGVCCPDPQWLVLVDAPSGANRP